MSPARREKPPRNAQVLERWAREWADAEGVPVARVQRSVSYMVIAAMLDTVRGAEGEPLFLIKGGVAMELRLALRARATQDLDAAFRAAAEAMIERLDDALEAGHADFTASRTTAREIGETRAIRVGVKLAYRGRPWATVPLEISSARSSKKQPRLQSRRVCSRLSSPAGRWRMRGPNRRHTARGRSQPGCGRTRPPIVRLLAETVRRTARWRRRKADEFRDDGKATLLG